MRTKHPLVKLAFGLAAILSPARAQFVHPGIFNSQEELDFVRDKIKSSSDNPMKQGLKSLQQFYGASLNYQNKPTATVDAMPSGSDASEQNFRDAGHAAYAHALQWVVTAIRVIGTRACRS